MSEPSSPSESARTPPRCTSRSTSPQTVTGDHQPSVYATAGIHPEQAHNATPDALAKLSRLAAHPRCVAVGEIGLDYYHLENPDIPIQQQAFIAQMKIATEVRRPIIIHCRTSELATPQAKAAVRRRRRLGRHPRPHHRALPALWAAWHHALLLRQRSRTPAVRSTLGFYLSFAGNLTYPKAQGIRDAAAFAPADRILVETDAPFLAPIPLRGQRNEPAYVAHTAAALAALRGISPQELAAITTENFHRLFPSTREPQQA